MKTHLTSTAFALMVMSITCNLSYAQDATGGITMKYFGYLMPVGKFNKSLNEDVSIPESIRHYGQGIMAGLSTSVGGFNYISKLKTERTSVGIIYELNALYGFGDGGKQKKKSSYTGLSVTTGAMYTYRLSDSNYKTYLNISYSLGPAYSHYNAFTRTPRWIDLDMLDLTDRTYYYSSDGWGFTNKIDFNFQIGRATIGLNYNISWMKNNSVCFIAENYPYGSDYQNERFSLSSKQTYLTLYWGFKLF